MAQPVNFPQRNSAIGDGGAHTDIGVYRDGKRTIACYALTPEDILSIMQTGRLWVIVDGVNFPATEITGDDPFDKSVN